MPFVFEATPNVFEEVQGNVVTNDASVAYGSLPLMSEGERNAFRVYTVAEPTIPDGKREVSRTYKRKSGVITAVPVLEDIPPPPPPNTISDRQFAQALAVLKIITQDEAEAWVGPGVVPAQLMGMVDQLPEAMQFPARMMLIGATTFELSHPTTQALIAGYNAVAPTQLDAGALWTLAASL